MEIDQADRKKRAIRLGICIGLIFILASSMVAIVAYHAISQNFKQLLANYSIRLVQSMLGQGVSLVEQTLHSDLQKISAAAARFAPPAKPDAAALPIDTLSDAHTLRVLYVSDSGTVASDSRTTDVREREDIAAALTGNSSLYGPYYNEAGEFVLCYSAPVFDAGRVVGALSVEKNGYLLCDLIKDIRFMQSGESYMLNSEGTDIAVSDLNHIEWVTAQYNGRRLLAEQEDPTTRSIVELEAKGLRGETGYSTYYWNDGLIYVAYAPIPSQGWVLLGGLREEEIVTMTNSALFASLSDNRALQLSLATFCLLTVLIVYWIVDSTKKNAKINENLEKIANLDALTGLFNRRYLETDIENRWKYPIKISGQAAIFMLDIDNFKQYNDRFGHQMGDECLRRVSVVFKNTFQRHSGYAIRYGGEEFLAIVFQLDRDTALALGQKLCWRVAAEKLPAPSGSFVTVSVGVCHAENTADIPLCQCIRRADCALYAAKRQGKNRTLLYEHESETETPDTVTPSLQQQ